MNVLRMNWIGGFPPTEQVVEAWYWHTIILAYYDGKTWRTADGQAIDGVTHWRFRQ